MSRIFLVIMLLFCFSYSSYADKQVILSSGQSYFGEITSDTETELTLKTRDGVLVTIMKDKVESIIEAKSRIVVQSGKVYIGNIVEDTENYIKLATSDGITVDIPKTQIVENGFESNKPEASNTNPSNYTNRNNGYRYMGDPNYRSVYDHDDFIRRYLGATLLIPGGINLVYARTSNNIGFRLQGGYIGKAYGAAANLLFNIRKSENFEINLGVCAGFTAIEEEYDRYSGGYYSYYSNTRMGSYTYAGATIDFNFYGFFLETGLAVGDEDFYTESISNPQLLLQFGYLVRL